MDPQQRLAGHRVPRPVTQGRRTTRRASRRYFVYELENHFKPSGARELPEDDPLLVLLRRYDAGVKFFNEAPVGGVGDEYWDQLAQDTWYGAQQEIVQSQPSATTAAGALMALDHVLKAEELFDEPSESGRLRMLWQLIKSARDYIASLETESD